VINILCLKRHLLNCKPTNLEIRITSFPHSHCQISRYPHRHRVLLFARAVGAKKVRGWRWRRRADGRRGNALARRKSKIKTNGHAPLLSLSRRVRRWAACEGRFGPFRAPMAAQGLKVSVRLHVLGVRIESNSTLQSFN
jgi:hypothetical protein